MQWHPNTYQRMLKKAFRKCHGTALKALMCFDRITVTVMVVANNINRCSTSLNMRYAHV